MIFCLKCHKPIRVGYVCKNCGTALKSTMKVTVYDTIEQRDEAVKKGKK
jgi:DNA-directed RNA polymerase subunit RPC12/RpoP